MLKFLLPALCVMLLSGCASAPVYTTSIGPSTVVGPRHTVKGGETLWSISRMYDVDLNALLRANSLRGTSVIIKGQVLSIPRSTATKPLSHRAVVKDDFIWPVRGDVISPFGSKAGKVINKGIDIRAEEGTGVVASRAGKVVFCDSYLKGFGKTIILDHGDRYQTVYSYNSDLLVKVGDEVGQRDCISKIGRTGRAKEPCLHFEIRKDGEPQNPSYYLP